MFFVIIVCQATQASSDLKLMVTKGSDTVSVEMGGDLQKKQAKKTGILLWLLLYGLQYFTVRVVVISLAHSHKKHNCYF